jgi:hypothetical protein
MRTVVCSLSLLVVATFGVRSQDKEKPKGEGIKCDMEYLEKTWGIKCKSLTLESSGKLKLLMEFTKDVSDLKAMREALTPPNLRDGKESEPTFYFHYFDKENVQLMKVRVEKLEGELSGKKGDAFRIYLPWGGGNSVNTVKIEGRPAEKKEVSKDKDKPKTDKPKDK